MKICKKCNIEKDISEFRAKKEKNGKYYYSISMCRECEREYDRQRSKNNKEYARQYYLKNKERLEEYKREWRYKNKERINKKRRENYAKKKQKI